MSPDAPPIQAAGTSTSPVPPSAGRTAARSWRTCRRPWARASPRRPIPRGGRPAAARPRWKDALSWPSAALLQLDFDDLVERHLIDAELPRLQVAVFKLVVLLAVDG